MTRLVGPLLLLAAPALAQDLRPSLEADLDGDGSKEVYTLIFDAPDDPEPSYSADLLVESENGVRLAEKVAWSGGRQGSLPELDVGPAGSLLITSQHGAYGRHRTAETITITHHDGDWYVTEVDYGWYDPADLDAGGSCDLDLLSGRGIAETAEGSREVPAPFPAQRLWDWRAGTFDPLDVCGFE